MSWLALAICAGMSMTVVAGEQKSFCIKGWCPEAVGGTAESELAEQECVKAKHHEDFRSPVQSCHSFCYSCQSSEGIQLLASKCSSHSLK